MKSTGENLRITLEGGKLISMAILAMEASRLVDEQKSASKVRQNDLPREIAPNEVFELSAVSTKGLLMALSRVRSGEAKTNDDVLAWSIYMIDEYGMYPRPNRSGPQKTTV